MKGSSSTKRSKKMLTIQEDSPSANLPIGDTPMSDSAALAVKTIYRKTEGEKERLGLIVRPDGSTLVAPGSPLGNCGFTVNDSHVSFLFENGNVVALDLARAIGDGKDDQAPPPSPSILRRIAGVAATVATMGMVSTTKPEASSLFTPLDFGKGVSMCHINSYGSRTMAVSTEGSLYEYDESLAPVLVEPKDTDGNVVKLGKIVEVYPGGELYAVQLEDKSFHLFCTLSQSEPFR